MASANVRVGRTAHYTSWVWVRNGLSDPALGTPQGRRLYALVRPIDATYERFGSGPGLERQLLARHRTLDARLEASIADGRVGQVVEIACGLSGRGVRLTRRHPGLRYLETDLPGMAALKRGILDGAGVRGPRHDVVELDALAHVGDRSLATVLAREFDRSVGTAIVTEGLLGYLERGDVLDLWRRIAHALGAFPHGTYLADLSTGDGEGLLAGPLFRLLVSAFTRGRHRLHFDDGPAAVAALRDAGFADAALHVPDDLAAHPRAIRIVEATALPATG